MASEHNISTSFLQSYRIIRQTKWHRKAVPACFEKWLSNWGNYMATVSWIKK